MSTYKLDKIWTKIGQNLDKGFRQTIWSYVSNISMKTFQQNMDIAWTFLCPKFVQYKKTWEKEIYSWTISEHFVQNMDNYLTKLSQTEIIWTNIGH